MNWKNIVEKQNAKTYVLPAGWDSRDKIAAELDCSPERVYESLKPCIAARTVEKRDFIVWDKALGMKTRITAYRRIDGESAAPAPNSAEAWTDEQFKIAAKAHADGESYAEIGQLIGKTKDAVRNKLRRVS